MATTIHETDSSRFSRITESTSGRSWAAALPATLLIVAAVVAIAYFAAHASTLSHELTGARQQATTAQQQADAAQQKAVALETQVSLLRSPGRTAVVLHAPEVKHGTAAAQWGVARWGEDQGKGWVVLDAYGLQPPPQGQAYDLWYQPVEGAPVRAGHIDPGPDGSAAVEAKNLPPLATGKKLFATIDGENATAPSTQILFSAELPKLEK